MVNTVICGECGERIKGDEVKCKECGGKFHSACINRVRVKCGTKWFCNKCYQPEIHGPSKKKRSAPAKQYRKTDEDTSLSEECRVYGAPKSKSEKKIETYENKCAKEEKLFITCKLEEITAQLMKLKCDMSYLQKENNNLKEDNEFLKLAIEKLCKKPSTPMCSNECCTKPEKLIVKSKENDCGEVCSIPNEEQKNVYINPEICCSRTDRHCCIVTGQHQIVHTEQLYLTRSKTL